MILRTLAQKQIARAGGQLRGQLGALAATWYWRWLPPAFVGMMVASKLIGMTGASGGHEFDAAFTAKDLPAAKTASAAS